MQTRIWQNYSLLTKSGPLFIFINKVLLKQSSYTHLFTQGLWLLWGYKGRDVELQETLQLQNPKSLYPGLTYACAQ